MSHLKFSIVTTDYDHFRDFRLVALSSALAGDVRAQDVRRIRRRPVSIQHRGEPPDLGANGALHVPVRHRAPPDETRGALFPDGIVTKVVI